MPSSGANPTAVFDRLGLKSKSYGLSGAVTEVGTGLPPGAGFAQALRELGGIYAAFARFLLWRADLLGADYLDGLRRFPPVFPPISPDRPIEILRVELPSASAELSAGLEAEPLWTTFSRTAWRSKYRGAPIVVQIARPPTLEPDFNAFERGIALLNHPDLADIASPPVLREFREWLRRCESTDTERAYLEVLSSQETLTDYPLPIADLSTSRVLCWPWIEGELVVSLIQRGSVDTVTKIAMAVLEGLFSFGIVDADLDLDAIALAGERLVIRRMNRLVSVPPALVNPAMKYVAAVMVGDAAITVETLITLAAGLSSRALESTLLNLLSALDPELKVDVWYPGSAAAFESNWRALATLDLARPLFLDCFHRNLVAIGYWNASAVKVRGRHIDAIEEAHWPAVDRVLRGQFARFRDSNVVAEWLAGSGLLMAGSMRQLNRTLEDVREDNLPAGVEAGAARTRPEHLNRAVRLAVAAGGLLMLFLACLRWGANGPEPLKIFLNILAPVALAGLFWVVAKIGQR